MDSTRLTQGRELKHETRESRYDLCHALSLFAIAENNINTSFKLILLFDDNGRENPITTKGWPSSADQPNAIEMAFRWRADGGLTLNVGLTALGSGPVVLPRKLCDFQGGLDPLPPPPPPLDLCMV